MDRACVGRQSLWVRAPVWLGACVRLCGQWAVRHPHGCTTHTGVLPTRPGCPGRGRAGPGGVTRMHARCECSRVILGGHLRNHYHLTLRPVLVLAWPLACQVCSGSSLGAGCACYSMTAVRATRTASGLLIVVCTRAIRPGASARSYTKCMGLWNATKMLR